MMTSPARHLRVAVVGAGLSGLAAAQRLASITQNTSQPLGFKLDVVVVEKSRGVGGRMATRRVEVKKKNDDDDGDDNYDGDAVPAHSGNSNSNSTTKTANSNSKTSNNKKQPRFAVADIGAQFFTARADAFRDEVRRWQERGAARVWSADGFDTRVQGSAGASAEIDERPRGDGHARFCGAGAMTAIPKLLAQELAAAAGSDPRRRRAEGDAASDASGAAGGEQQTEEEDAFSASLRLQTRVSSVSCVSPSGAAQMQWRLEFDDPVQSGATARAARNEVAAEAPIGAKPEAEIFDALVITAPSEQALALFGPDSATPGGSGGVVLPSSVVDELRAIQYDPCFAVVAAFDRATALAAYHPAAVQKFANGVAGEPINFIADNSEKGLGDAESVPSVTIHAGPEWTRAHYDDNLDDVTAQLISLARPFIGEEPQLLASSVQRWRFSRPSVLCQQPCLSVGGRGTEDSQESLPPLVFCGDAFRAAAVEGAYTSGVAAADDIVARLGLKLPASSRHEEDASKL